ncbi:MAG TPA: cell division protein ZapA [Fervidobacterium sp.]|nr:cell division protein ZapA [Fervidobacterium sp.]HON03540.1 cell division protein ZapA [Fervidobacterium sp.]HOP82232.1 cell division protein ZapA [Fervidobacterium sp.]HOS52170.1 cell division protein ZapA [Fervidobacterium sp.]HPC80005.1 cell division protein ZapA [Fervidobacterium sp.]
MKKVKITLFGKDYEFTSNSSDEAIDYVHKRLKELQASYNKLYGDTPFDELLVLVLCDVLEQEYNSQKAIDSTLSNLREKLKMLRLEGE